LVLLSHNTPGAAEAPAGRYETDLLRMVLRGSCVVGDRTYEPFEFSAVAAGVSQGPVHHGPAGSTQLVFFADRRGWRPVGEEPTSDGHRRLDELSEVLAPLLAVEMP
jgi:hypothetical protein